MYYKKEFGTNGEDISSLFLKENNYLIIQKNYKCKLGEIDIIAYDYNLNIPELCFIEVKSRHNKSCGLPAESVTKYKQHHIINTAKYYLVVNKIEKQFIRFDVIEIYENSSKSIYINHIKNAFTA